MARVKGLCILGSTGSIGCSCLAVVRSLPDRLRVVALCAGKNLDLLATQIAEFSPLVVSVASARSVEPLRERLRGRGYTRPLRILVGTDGQVEAATLEDVDYVVSGSHGVTGLVATYAAVEAGKAVGLANKEVLVAAGEIFMRAARKRGAAILPIDSEHCAVQQCLRAGESREVRRLILTGSGGPFLKTARKRLDSVTPEMALKHPVWKMGGRITIDSATLMNKGLEIIEAHWLFGLESKSIDVLIHPESIVHSMIEFCDGSVVAQLSIADMRLPIQYALTYPERVPLGAELPGLNLVSRPLRFYKPDTRRFPCLDLARVALEEGGSRSCELNAADEVAVEAFIERRLRLTDIPRVIEKVIRSGPVVHLNKLEDVLECDRDARRRAREAVSTLAGAPVLA